MTDPGQHILPGADFTREVPLPPQPPLEDESCNCDLKGSLANAPHRNWCHAATLPARPVEPTSEPGSSEDEVIPQAAIEAAAASVYGCYGSKLRFEDSAPAVQEQYLADARLALEAAMPHLRAFQIETQVRVGYELGRREAGEEIAAKLGDTLEAEFNNDTYVGLDTARHIVREVTKGDRNG